ncbi:hypothetical protein Y1Q_0020008 [Alligator mississippiensis]|uniref:Uncharacterized protein n=1 Tax=Alligator mississippiensis TaxID=8496 RepID=A0A151LYN3_ALLMI|nr:hypothetical protein Y1Q_0020008 [Alligator mississippiensis]
MGYWLSEDPRTLEDGYGPCRTGHLTHGISEIKTCSNETIQVILHQNMVRLYLVKRSHSSEVNLHELPHHYGKMGASETAVGTVLCQELEDIEHLIAYASRKPNTTKT